jgi:hypothetical protein
MRKEKIWLIVHPEEDRIFVQPKPVSATRGRLLRQEGYMIYMAEVTLPPIEDLAPVIEAAAGVPVEQWSKDDAPDVPGAPVELAPKQGARPAVPHPVAAGVSAGEKLTNGG